MDDILEILAKDARATVEDIAKLSGKDPAAVRKAVKKYEKDGVIVGYRAMINQDLLPEPRVRVRALIEVSISPQKDVGFDHIAERIYSFPEVASCYLVSGTYDLLVVVEGESLQTVANFIAAKLSPLEHVRSTATHFLLRKYKEDGHILKSCQQPGRLPVAP